MIARFEIGEEPRCDRRHTGCCGARILGAFQEAHALFEHGDGRIAEARVLVAGAFLLEAGFCLLGAVVDEALGEKHGLGGFAMLRADHAAVHELRFRRPGLTSFRRVLVRCHCDVPFFLGGDAPPNKKPGLHLRRFNAEAGRSEIRGRTAF